MSSQKKVTIHDSWYEKLASEFNQPYFSDLKQFLSEEKKAGKTIYPPGNLLFNAFDSTPFEAVKVVILGQDPYHGPQQAMGLSFSVPDGISKPPSLNNICKEIVTDLGIELSSNGNLQAWANQGVLLLNAGLTVEAHKANSHKDIGWHKFTDAVIRTLSAETEGIVFLLWGGFAKKKVKLIDQTKHHVLTSGHPSPLSANRGYWFGNKHFSKTNALLEEQGKTAIDWSV